MSPSTGKRCALWKMMRTNPSQQGHRLFLSWNSNLPGILRCGDAAVCPNSENYEHVVKVPFKMSQNLFLKKSLSKLMNWSDFAGNYIHLLKKNVPVPGWIFLLHILGGGWKDQQHCGSGGLAFSYVRSHSHRRWIAQEHIQQSYVHAGQTRFCPGLVWYLIHIERVHLCRGEEVARMGLDLTIEHAP